MNPDSPFQQNKPVKKPKVYKLGKHGLLAFVILAALVAGYIAFDTWMVNQKTREVVANEEVPDADAPAWIKAEEGANELPLPADKLKNYKVAADHPRALYIDSLKIAARILPMGVNGDESIQSPINIFDAGWYKDGPKPGDEGTVFIDGHASGATRQGLFAYLDTIKAGSLVRIENGAGIAFNYKVTKVETVPLEGLDMAKVLKPQGEAKKALVLMTCTGTWIKDKLTYDQRVIVYAEQ